MTTTKKDKQPKKHKLDIKVSKIKKLNQGDLKYTASGRAGTTTVTAGCAPHCPSSAF